MMIDKSLLVPLIMLMIVVMSGCICPALPGNSPTVVPTVTSTPGPSTTTAPPTIPPVRSIATGTQIVWELQGGYGQLVVKNQIKGNLVLSLESSSSHMSRIARQEIYYGKYLSMDDIIKGVEKVTRDQVQRLALILTPRQAGKVYLTNVTALVSSSAIQAECPPAPQVAAGRDLSIALAAPRAREPTRFPARC